VRRITVNGLVYSLPFEHLLRALTAEEFGRLDADIAANGVQQAVVTATTPTWGRILVDGMHRATVAERRGLDIPQNLVVSLGKISDAVARERALALNLNRRHLTVEEQQAARGERIRRVTEAKSNGESIRAIAAKEGVSPGQIQRDLQGNASGVSWDTPVEIPAPQPARILGTDGKAYAAPKTPPRPKRVRVADRAHHAADQLAAAIRALLKGTQRGRLELLAREAGIPIAGNDWPAVDRVRAVLRDLASGSASA
jgi:ParB-like chromosome segregation protein Spo0J